jgi:hypothetical protein
MVRRRDLSQLSDEDLLNIIGSVGAELQATEPMPIEIENNPSLLRFPVPVR